MAYHPFFFTSSLISWAVLRAQCVSLVQPEYVRMLRHEKGRAIDMRGLAKGCLWVLLALYSAGMSPRSHAAFTSALWSSKRPFSIASRIPCIRV